MSSMTWRALSTWLYRGRRAVHVGAVPRVCEALVQLHRQRGPGEYCTSRHGMHHHSIKQGFKMHWMTWRAIISARSHRHQVKHRHNRRTSTGLLLNRSTGRCNNCDTSTGMFISLFNTRNTGTGLIINRFTRSFDGCVPVLGQQVGVAVAAVVRKVRPLRVRQVQPRVEADVRGVQVVGSARS